VVDQQVDMAVAAVELDQFGLEVRAYVPHDRLHAGQVPVGEHRVPELRHENQVNMHRENAVPAGTDTLTFCHRPT